MGHGVRGCSADRGHDVMLACRDAEQARAIADTGRNPRYLPDLDLGGVAGRVDDAPLADAELVASPSRARLPRRRRLAARRRAVLVLTKGLDPATGERLSTLVAGRPVAVLSGPNMAEEVARGLPAAAVIASEDERSRSSRRRSTRTRSAST